ncbi:transmembrane-type terpene cyclase [Companilactobacillus jidongensis]|uniref:transmembrane-type terpene cyclase n=1 Tax=Companilactobacillus jidongensis TaxID=2486006 RepID=UPI000F777ABF|nr:hypothetical protein [Companilactobacillus jidongensis]
MNNILPLISGIAWTITYSALVYRGFKDKIPGMPLAALCLNFAWETTFAYIYPPAGSLMTTVINAVWMILDIGIVVSMIKFGPRDYGKRFGISKNIFYLMLVIGMVVSFGIMVTGAKYFVGLPSFHQNTFEVAKFIAFTQNLIMSILFLSQFYQRKQVDNPIKGQSFTIAITKCIGTGLTVGIAAAFRDSTGFMAVLIVPTIICDFWYIGVIYRELRAQGINPLRRF